jgi:hypothetical protein
MSRRDPNRVSLHGKMQKAHAVTEHENAMDDLSARKNGGKAAVTMGGRFVDRTESNGDSASNDTSRNNSRSHRGFFSRPRSIRRGGNEGFTSAVQQEIDRARLAAGGDEHPEHRRSITSRMNQTCGDGLSSLKAKMGMENGHTHGAGAAAGHLRAHDIKHVNTDTFALNLIHTVMYGPPVLVLLLTLVVYVASVFIFGAIFYMFGSDCYMIVGNEEFTFEAMLWIVRWPPPAARGAPHALGSVALVWRQTETDARERVQHTADLDATAAGTPSSVMRLLTSPRNYLHRRTRPSAQPPLSPLAQAHVRVAAPLCLFFCYVITSCACLSQSTHTFSTVGFGTVAPFNSCVGAQIVVLVESWVSILVVAAIGGYVVKIFLRPLSRVRFSKVILLNNGRTRCLATLPRRATHRTMRMWHRRATHAARLCCTRRLYRAVAARWCDDRRRRAHSSPSLHAHTLVGMRSVCALLLL